MPDCISAVAAITNCRQLICNYYYCRHYLFIPFAVLLPLPAEHSTLQFAYAISPAAIYLLFIRNICRPFLPFIPASRAIWPQRIAAPGLFRALLLQHLGGRAGVGHQGVTNRPAAPGGAGRSGWRWRRWRSASATSHLQHAAIADHRSAIPLRHQSQLLNANCLHQHISIPQPPG